MALYNIEKLEVKVIGKRQFEVTERETVDVTAYADDLLNEKENFIIDSIVSMGHLTKEASTNNLNIIFQLETLSGTAKKARIHDKRTGYPLFDLVQRVNAFKVG